MASVTRLIQVVKPQVFFVVIPIPVISVVSVTNIHFQAKQCQRLFSASVISKTPERFGTANGESGWTWDGKDRVGMGGKDAGKSLKN